MIGPGPDGGFTGLDGEEVRMIAAAQDEVAAAQKVPIEEKPT